MERERSAPSQKFATGFEVEKTTLTWKIHGFPMIRKDKSMIDSQRIEFTAGETTGHLSQWSVYLTEKKINDKTWVGIFLKRLSPEAIDPAFKSSYAQIRFGVKNSEGKLIKDLEISRQHIATEFVGKDAWGYWNFIDPGNATDCPEENLVIEMTFKLYSPSHCQSKSTSSLEAIMAKFQVRFSEQLRKDLSGLLKNPVHGTDIKIVSNDKEYFMQRGILAVRSDVFAVMLGSDMIEATSGVIDLPDISSPALEVLLNFLNTGELLPEWSNTEVIVELTNAAAKYQLQDLLEFLDATLGKVCQLGNVWPLIILAKNLSLKVAEEELLGFVRKEGMNSTDNLIQMWSTDNGLHAAGDDESDEPQAKKQKVN